MIEFDLLKQAPEHKKIQSSINDLKMNRFFVSILNRVSILFSLFIVLIMIGTEIYLSANEVLVLLTICLLPISVYSWSLKKIENKINLLNFSEKVDFELIKKASKYPRVRNYLQSFENLSSKRALTVIEANLITGYYLTEETYLLYTGKSDYT